MKKALSLALGGILLGGAVAHAQEFDDRFYISPRVGAVFADSDRLSDDAPFLGLSVGRFVTPNWAIDLEVTQNDFDLDNVNKEWEHLGLGVGLRYFFNEGQALRPYFMMGLGALRHDRWNAPRGWNPMANIGGGVQ
ncbi:MAG: porin family protein, partial [Xanthomonadales bacterium]|nr:porin family protein [Xanthomonadales bacterium]